MQDPPIASFLDFFSLIFPSHISWLVQLSLMDCQLLTEPLLRGCSNTAGLWQLGGGSTCLIFVTHPWEPTVFMCTCRLIWELEGILSPLTDAGHTLFGAQEQRTPPWPRSIWQCPTMAFSRDMSFSTSQQHGPCFYIACSTLGCGDTILCALCYFLRANGKSCLALTSSVLLSLHSHFHCTSEALFSVLRPLNWSFKIQPFLSKPLYNFQKQSFKHVNAPNF